MWCRVWAYIVRQTRVYVFLIKWLDPHEERNEIVNNKKDKEWKRNGGLGVGRAHIQFLAWLRVEYRFCTNKKGNAISTHSVLEGSYPDDYHVSDVKHFSDQLERTSTIADRCWRRHDFGIFVRATRWKINRESCHTQKRVRNQNTLGRVHTHTLMIITGTHTCALTQRNVFTFRPLHFSHNLTLPSPSGKRCKSHTILTFAQSQHDDDVLMMMISWWWHTLDWRRNYIASFRPTTECRRSIVDPILCDFLYSFCWSPRKDHRLSKRRHSHTEFPFSFPILCELFFFSSSYFYLFLVIGDARYTYTIYIRWCTMRLMTYIVQRFLYAIMNIMGGDALVILNWSII